MTSLQHRGKEKEDQSGQAIEKEIKKRDKILIQNTVFPHKFMTQFNNEEYTFMEKKEKSW